MAHVNYKGLLRQALIFILYFSIILISFFFWGSDKEYNLNQTIARGFISNDAIFFEIHDPSKGTARFGELFGNNDSPELQKTGNADFIFSETGGISMDTSPIEGEDPDYVMTNNVMATGMTQIESVLASGSGDYIAGIHTGLGRFITYKGSPELPPMIEGRFFTEEECLKQKPLAVIGKDYIPQTYLESAKRYLDYYGNKYEVIGITGVTGPSTLDSLIFVNMGSVAPEKQLTGRLYIDSNNNTENLYEDLNRASLTIYGQELDRLATPKTLIDVVSGGMYLKSYLKALLLCMGIFLYLSILIQTVNANRRSLSVMKMLGVSFGRSYRKLNKSNLLTALAGLIGGLIADLVFLFSGYFALPFKESGFALAVCFLTALGLLVIWNIILMITSWRLNPIESIRTI